MDTLLNKVITVPVSTLLNLLYCVKVWCYLAPLYKNSQLAWSKVWFSNKAITIVYARQILSFKHSFIYKKFCIKWFGRLMTGPNQSPLLFHSVRIMSNAWIFLTDCSNIEGTIQQTRTKTEQTMAYSDSCCQSVSKSVSQSVCESVSQSVSQLVSHIVSQPVSQ